MSESSTNKHLWFIASSLLFPMFAATIVLSSPAAATVLGFDEKANGGVIEAPPTFALVNPNFSYQGPNIGEYTSYDVTFQGGVVLNYSRFGGPDDPRVRSGKFLASPPNLLATTDFQPLKDNRLLPGTIDSKFSAPVSSVSISIRNGKAAENGRSGSEFTLDAFNGARKVDSDSRFLESFSESGQDGELNVSGASIDRVEIKSTQENGNKNFGIDNFNYSLKDTGNELHNSLRRLNGLNLSNASSQKTGKSNLENALNTVPTLPESTDPVLDAKFEDFAKVVLDGVDLLDLLLRGIGDPAFPTTIICPENGCQSYLLPTASERVISSIFDIRQFSLPVQVSTELANAVAVGDSFAFNSSAFPGGPTSALLHIDAIDNFEGTSSLLNVGVKSITRVSEVDAPSQWLFILPTMLCMFGVWRRQRRYG